MAFGQIDPARLEGDALTRWYLRSPAEIEDERRRAAAKAYDAFFSQEGSATDTASDLSPATERPANFNQPAVLTKVANNQDDRKRKQDCIEQCTDLTLPTDNYGSDFFRCVQQCMGVNDFPEWRRYFPSAKQTPPASHAPRPASVAPRRPSTGFDNMFPWQSNPPSGPWWLPLALPPYVPNT
jgi:hypothetical protein